jgi:hypothetical protein
MMRGLDLIKYISHVLTIMIPDHAINVGLMRVELTDGLTLVHVVSEDELATRHQLGHNYIN